MSVSSLPGLSDVLDAYINAAFENVNGPIPAIVETFNQTLSICDAKPVVDPVVGGAPIAAPVLRSIPVVFPASVSGGVTWPLASGAFVLLLPSGVDIAQWVTSGVIGPAKSARRFSLSDVVAVPCIVPKSAPLPATTYDAAATVVSGAVVKLGDSTAVAAVGNGMVADANNTKVLTWITAVNAALAGLGITAPTPPALNAESLTKVKGV